MRPTKFDGMEAKILGDHPHSGKLAICKGADKTPVGYGLVFEDENGDYEVRSCFFNADTDTYFVRLKLA